MRANVFGVFIHCELDIRPSFLREIHERDETVVATRARNPVQPSDAFGVLVEALSELSQQPIAFRANPDGRQKRHHNSLIQVDRS